ncbi:MAG: SUMF1/EgtB/PvdO family nonheme iron enzyme [Erythrobacter sp.]
MAETAGARWQKPYGPDGRNARAGQPVAHLAWDDMEACARWKGSRLPTKAEGEFAAALAGKERCNPQPRAKAANRRQGGFALVSQASDAFKGVAPVGCVAPKAAGLYDRLGKVWQVTADDFRPDDDAAACNNPKRPSENDAYDLMNPVGPSRVMKRGSHPCAHKDRQRCRPQARQGRDPGLGVSPIGFRLVYDAPES